MILYNPNNNEQQFYINKFISKYDINFTRNNHYVDISYGEMDIEFIDYKLFINFTIHIAGNFELPQYSIKSKLSFSNIEIDNIELIKTNNSVDENFPYGYSDSSKVFLAKCVLDLNEYLDFFNKNQEYKIIMDFYLDTTVLNGIYLNKENLNSFISNIENASLVFDFSLDNQGIISNNSTSKIEHPFSYKLISQTINHNNNVINSFQMNNSKYFEMCVSNYELINHSIQELFKIKNLNNELIKIKIITVFVNYKNENGFYEKTNELEINEFLHSRETEISYQLNNVALLFDEQTKKYKLEKNNIGFFVNKCLEGDICLKTEINLGGKIKKYDIYVGFSFIQNEYPSISYIENQENLIININDSFYEIKE